MNNPAANPPIEKVETIISEAEAMFHQVEDLIRRHPVAAALVSVGIGCAVGMAARELLTPEPPTTKRRALNLLEDIQQRLAEIVEPVSDRVSELADDGVSAVKSGLHSVTHSKAAGRFRNLFS